MKKKHTVNWESRWDQSKKQTPLWRPKQLHVKSPTGPLNFKTLMSKLNSRLFFFLCRNTFFVRHQNQKETKSSKFIEFDTFRKSSLAHLYWSCWCIFCPLGQWHDLRVPQSLLSARVLPACRKWPSNTSTPLKSVGIKVLQATAIFAEGEKVTELKKKIKKKT